jgi:hypothetical protein
MNAPSLVKKTYAGVALFAIVNLLTLAGVTAYALTSGLLSKDKAVQIASILNGRVHANESGSPTDASGAALVSSGLTSTGPSSSSQVSSQEEMNILLYESERLKAELDQQLALVHSMMLRVTTAREALASERKAFAQRQESQTQAQNDDGFKKQIELYEALRPKVAAEHLLSLDSLDDAAAILTQMQTRKAKAIIETAKRGDQMKKMKDILRRVSEASPERTELLEGAAP